MQAQPLQALIRILLQEEWSRSSQWLNFRFEKKRTLGWSIWRELKRREKQRVKDAAKASKAPTAAADSTLTIAAAAASPSEDGLNPNVSSKHKKRIPFSTKKFHNSNTTKWEVVRS